MILLTDEDKAALPRMFETDGQGPGAVAHVRLVAPGSEWQWYLLEYDGANSVYGVVAGPETKRCYWSLAELESPARSYGLRIERDPHFTPAPLAQLVPELFDAEKTHSAQCVADPVLCLA